MPTLAEPAQSLKRKPGPPAIPPDWDRIKSEMIAGVPSHEVAEKYGVHPATIRCKASEQQWPTPHRLAKCAREARSKADKAAEALRKANPSKSSRPPSRASELTETESVNLSAGEKGRQNAMMIATFTHQQITAAVGEDSKIGVPKNWKELQTAFGMSEKATGRDKPLTAIQVNIGGQMWADVDPGDVAEPL